MTMRTPVLEDRYGVARERRRGRLAGIVGGVVVLVALLAWGAWTGFGGSASTLDVQTVGAEVQGAGATTVRWQVTGRARTTLVCAIEAQDPSGVVVGLVERTVRPTGASERSGTTIVRTVRPASDGLIASCRDA